MNPMHLRMMPSTISEMKKKKEKRKRKRKRENLEIG